MVFCGFVEVEFLFFWAAVDNVMGKGKGRRNFSFLYLGLARAELEHFQGGR